jgi:hypothetical protein
MTMTDEELQRRVSAAYKDELGDPVPDRLSQLLAAPKVVDFAAAREQRAARRRGPLTWAQLGGLAASVMVGIALGWGWQWGPRGDALVAEQAGELVAGRALAHALDTQLAADTGAVGVQLTLVDKAGRFCRTFSAQRIAGLACRNDGRWSVVASARNEAAAAGGMRQAASDLPKPVLDAVDARIASNAFDAAREKQARDGGWKK